MARIRNQEEYSMKNTDKIVTILLVAGLVFNLQPEAFR